MLCCATQAVHGPAGAIHELCPQHDRKGACHAAVGAGHFPQQGEPAPCLCRDGRSFGITFTFSAFKTRCFAVEVNIIGTRKLSSLLVQQNRSPPMPVQAYCFFISILPAFWWPCSAACTSALLLASILPAMTMPLPPAQCAPLDKSKYVSGVVHLPLAVHPSFHHAACAGCPT